MYIYIVFHCQHDTSFYHKAESYPADSIKRTFGWKSFTTIHENKV